MRIRISHETTFRYEPETRWVIQNLRLTPRSFDSQYVLRWRVCVSLDGALRHCEDTLGNVVHAFSHPKAVERVEISAIGEVETSDAVGVMRGTVETLPESMFLRKSEHAHVTAALREFVAEAVGGAADDLDKLHRLMGAIHKEIELDPEAAPARGGGVDALALKKATAADFAQLFIASARHIEIPARYVSGYLVPPDGETAAGMTAWAEAFTPGLGWVAFDCAHDLCADSRYVRVAIGFDSASAAPFRTSHSGAGAEHVDTVLTIVDSPWGSQSQSQ